MYTQCPDCHIAFRVTAQVLQKAAGRVRCGGCGNAFSAIDYLSEQLPRQAEPPPAARQADATDAPADENESQAIDDFASRSEALLKTLDQLAGDDEIRIEDTGIEWRVLEDVGEEASPAEDTGVAVSLDDVPIGADRVDDSGDQQPLNLQQAPRDERRYDDNTPLPDDFDDEVVEPYTPPTPARRAEDHDADLDFDTHQIDLAMGEESDDWAELLDDEETTDAESPSTESTGVTDIPLEVEEELAAIHNELLESAATLKAPPRAEPAHETELSEQARSDEEATEVAETAGFVEVEALEEHAASEELQQPDSSSQPEAEPQATVDEQPEALTPHDEGQDAAGLEVLDETAAADSQAAPIEPDGHADAAVPGDLAAHAELQASAAADDPFDDYEEDELTPDQEADIVGKLRESTGAFQKQIEAAQQALDRGDIDYYEGSDEQLDDRAETAPEALATEGEAAGDEALETAPGDAGNGSDEELLDEFQPPVDDVSEQPVELDTVTTEEHSESSATAQDDEELSQDDRLAQTMRMAGIDPADLDADNVETIVMEGTFVSDALESESETDAHEVITQLEDPDSLIDTYMMNKGKVAGGRRSSDPAGIAVVLSVVALALLLALQWAHNSRESLATYGFFKQTLGPVYRAVGQPVTPEWDIKGWRFINTRGSADENNEVLTIFSNISNASEQALPYPLVHVSLTDRYEEIIGSTVLEPGEYLAGDLDPSKPVVPGDKFGAVIAIESPSAEAVGFKLNVCYRVATGLVRCATEDFKD